MQLPLRIGLCGGLRVEVGAKRIEGDLAGRQGRETFSYLVLNRARSVSRDELAALIWPDRPPRAPDAALSTILARLRRVLGHSVLAGRGQLNLLLPPDSWVDVEAAEQRATRAEDLAAGGEPTQALVEAASGLDLLAAPLLPEVQHNWIEQRRADVDDLRSRLYTVTVRSGLELGGSRLDDAERAAHYLIDREPFRESGYAMLMEVLAARGDVAEALLVYERLRVLLRDELGITPSARVARLHERLLRAEPAGLPATVAAPATGADAVPPLPAPLVRNSRRTPVGRDRELALLRSSWSGLSPENRSVIALSGEPGIGKTMLTAAFASEVHRSGGVVLYGQAQEDAIIPYAPLVEALRHYVTHASDLGRDSMLSIHLGELAWLIPELAKQRADRRMSTGDPRLEQARLYQAAAALLAHISSSRSTLLVLEDVHCADAETILMLRQLLREPTRWPVLALLTFQEGEISGEHPLYRLLSELRRDIGVTRLTLHGLTDEAICQLVANGTQPTAEFIRSLREHTSGNPFFIEEVVRTLREAGSESEGGSVSMDELPDLPEGVRDVIQNRLRRLEPPTRAVLVAAAVLGQGFSLALLEAMVGDAAPVGHTIDGAVRTGLIVEDSESGDLYRFRHALAREAIYRSIGRSARADLHLRAARALERRRNTRYVEPAELARHFVASDRSDEIDNAIAYLREAANRALETHAYEDAAGHYRRALEVLKRHRPHETATRCELLLRLGSASWKGSGPSARVIFEQAVAVARGLDEHSKFAEATLGLGGRFYAPTGPDEPYIHLLEEALHWIRDDQTLHTSLLGRLAEHLIFVDPSRAKRLSQQAVATARALGDPILLAATLMSRHAALLHVAHVVERKRVATEALELARRHGERELEALGHHWLLYDHLELGDIVGALAAQTRLDELAREMSQPLYRHAALVWQRVIELLNGRFERAAQLAHEALNLARGAHGEGAQEHFIAQQLAVVPYTGGGEQLRPAVEARAMCRDTLWRAAVHLLRAETSRLSPEDCAFEALSLEQVASLPRNIFWLTTLAWLAEPCEGERDEQRAALLYELLAPYADRFVQLSFNGSFGCVHRQLGLLAAQLGQSQHAAEHFEEAIARHADAPAPALEARTRCDYAVAMSAGRAAGSIRDARRMAAAALELAEACGATRLTERVRALMPAPALAPR